MTHKPGNESERFVAARYPWFGRVTPGLGADLICAIGTVSKTKSSNEGRLSKGFFLDCAGYDYAPALFATSPALLVSDGRRYSDVYGAF